MMERVDANTTQVIEALNRGFQDVCDQVAQGSRR